MNAGSLRLDLPAGELTYGQLCEAFPFEEGLAILHLRGEELNDLLRILTRENRGFAQAAGLRWDGAQARTCAGEPLQADRVYQVGTNEFVASGGDGARRVLRVLAPGRIAVRRDLESRAVFLEWLRKSPADRLAEPCP